MSNTYSAGVATAYGAAVRGGYTGTYAEWCAAMANFGDKSQQAIDAAEQAANSATEAANSATDAADSASAAATSKGNAADSAAAAIAAVANAAGSASAAAQSATGAAGSASAAATSEANAAASETAAAGSAATAAQELGKVQAAGAAQVAEITAEGARVLDSIPVDYTVLSEDVSDLKSAVDNGIAIPIAWEQGRLNATTGALSNSDYAIRSKEFIPVVLGQTGILPLFADEVLPNGATNFVVNVVEYSSVSPLTKVTNTIINRTAPKALKFNDATTYYKVTANYLTAGQYAITPDKGYLCNFVLIGSSLYKLYNDVNRALKSERFDMRPNKYVGSVINGRINSSGMVDNITTAICTDEYTTVSANKTYKVSINCPVDIVTKVTLYYAFFTSADAAPTRSVVTDDKFIDVNDGVLGGYITTPSDGLLKLYVLGNAELNLDPETFHSIQIIEDADPIRLLLCGDSICEGLRNDGRGFGGGIGYPYKNIGIGNTSLGINSVKPNDSIPVAFVRDIGDYVPDVIIADGGFNDYANHSAMGSVPDRPALNDTEAEALDITTVTGGIGYLFYQMTKLFPLAKRIFVITHKVGKPNSGGVMRYFPIYKNSNEDVTLRFTQNELYETQVAMCKLYSVKIVNVYMDSNLDSGLPGYVSPSAWSESPNIANQYCIDSDCIHPTELGYKKYYYPLVKDAVKVLLGK